MFEHREKEMNFSFANLGRALDRAKTKGGRGPLKDHPVIRLLSHRHKQPPEKN